MRVLVRGCFFDRMLSGVQFHARYVPVAKGTTDASGGTEAFR